MNGKLVYGVGVYEKGKYLACLRSKPTKEYSLWQKMLERCYSKKYHEKQPTYVDSGVSENFLNFQYFAEWCQHQVGFGVAGYQLDKDIISGGDSKLYSETTCVFVPSQLNTFMVNRRAKRGKFPLGVDFVSKNGTFRAYCRNGGSKTTWLGYYSNQVDAFLAYKTYKECLAKQLALRYDGVVDQRVIAALNNFTVEITD